MSRPDEQETRDLIALAQAGGAAGKRARDRVVLQHMPLVAAQAKRLHRPAIEEDLIQAGVIGPHDSRDGKGGLMLAIERFDPSKGVRFATFATWWIRAAMESEIGLHGAAVGPTRRQRDRRRKIRKTAARLEAQSGQLPSVAEVLEALPPKQQASCKRQSVEAALMPLLRRALTLPGAGGSDASGHNANDDYSSPERLAAQEPLQDSTLEIKRLTAKLGALLDDALTPQELEIVRAYYGLLPGRERGEEETLASVADRLGVPRGTVKGIHQRALVKLRAVLEAAPAAMAAAAAAFGMSLMRGGA